MRVFRAELPACPCPGRERQRKRACGARHPWPLRPEQRALRRAERRVRLVAAVDAELVEALLRHPYTHHVRELHRLLWLALSGSTGRRVALTPEVRAELDRSGAQGPQGSSGAQGSQWASGPLGPQRASGPQQGPSEQEIERRHIEAALARTGGKVAPAARALGLKNRHVLYRLMERHGLRGAGGEGEPEE